MLQLIKVSVAFPSRQGVLRSRGDEIKAVDGVDLHVNSGETLGLVGESGSGKSTLARVAVGLQKVTSGALVLDGSSVDVHRGKDLARLRSRVQMVFQDPTSCLNPMLTVGSALEEAIRQRGTSGTVAVRSEAARALDAVQLPQTSLQRYPREFSGGQRQRIAIARALTAKPALLICDEPLSGLDVSTQAEVINLFRQLQSELGLAYLFIGHDLAVIRHVSDRVCVLYRGRVMETGAMEAVWEAPQHPYTQMLLASAPEPDPEAQRGKRLARQRLRRTEGRVWSGTGCPYAGRCPEEMEECNSSFPPYIARNGRGVVACHARTPKHSA